MTVFAAGARVRVRNDWPEARGPAHIRTPHYVRGRTGTVIRLLGVYPDPEYLAFGRPAPRRLLYHVAFPATVAWGDADSAADIAIELYDHWLEPT
jgi:nitrile hydratase